MYKVGDRARLNDPRCLDHGKGGMITEISVGGNLYKFQVDGARFSFWYTSEHLIAIDAVDEDESPWDFDRTGLGISGLGRHVEEQAVPTIAQMARRERLEAQAHTCARCGESDVDGAMFTTDPDRRVCDDCF